MMKKRPLRLLVSAAALMLAAHESAWSESPVDEPTTPTATAEPTPSPATESRTSEPAREPETTTPDTTAPEVTATPESPPSQTPASGTPRRQWGSMTPEERRAQHEQRFNKMLERVTKRREEIMKRHEEIQEIAERWDSYWEILDAMTPEQKEAVYAIFGYGGKGCHHRSKGHRKSPRMPMQPPMMEPPEFDFPSDLPFPQAPGYGYGP